MLGRIWPCCKEKNDDVKWLKIPHCIITLSRSVCFFLYQNLSHIFITEIFIFLNAVHNNIESLFSDPIGIRDAIGLTPAAV